MQRLITVIFLLFLVNFVAHAQKDTLQKYDFNIQSLTNVFEIADDELQYFEDKANNIGVKKISTDEYKHKFKTLQQGQTFKPFTNYWLRIRVKSDLELGSNWILSMGKVTNVKVNVTESNGKYLTENVGQFVPTSEKTLKNGRYNVVKISLNPKSEKTIYINFINEIEYSPTPNLKLLPEAQWLSNINFNNLAQGFFQGLLWMMLLYNLLLYFTLGDKSYIFYVFYILATSIYFLEFHGYWAEFVMGELPTINYVVIPFSIYIAFLCYLYFMRNFLKTYEISPMSDLLLKIVSYLFMIASAGLLGLALINYGQYMQLEKYFNLAIEITLLIMLVFIFTFGDNSARYFALGTACMLLGGAVMLLGALGYMEIHQKIYYFQWGIVAQVLVFSFALSERFKQTELDKRNSQRALIDQLQENHLLYNKVQRELEDKVKERTNEIENQKQELQAKSTEIELQHAELTHQKHLTEHKNKHITDSITYASRIQGAMLNAYNQIETRFRDGFIFFRPRDIVSGDFYWYAEVPTIVRQEREIVQANSAYGNGRMMRALPQPMIAEKSSILSNLKITIVADCTGHGVPGAFMTVMRNAILNEIVNENRVTEPNRILQELDKKVMAMLRKQNAEKQLQDGMDIIVMVHDDENKTLTVSCAKNPLYYVRDFEIHEVSASKSGIGFSSRIIDKQFEKKVIQIQDDDIFYATTDGFQDQFGGEDKRKYMKKSMREFFLKMSHLPLKAQKQRLDDEFTAWKGNTQQTDDVLIVGLKF